MTFSRMLFLELAFSVSAFPQIITTIAGTGEPGYSGDGGAAVSATFSDPRWIGVDAAGNVYVVDSNNVRIRKISPSGQVVTVAGTGEAASTVRGPAIKTGFVGIGGLAIAPNGTIYIADSEGVQKVDPAGTLSFVVTEQSVQAVAVSPAGAIYLGGVVDVSVLGTKGSLRRIAGTDLGDSGDGGPALKAKFYVAQVAIDPAGNVYVVDKEAHRIRKFTPGGIISTFAGNGEAGFSGDHGPASQAQLNRPQSMAFDVAGNAYIADTANFRVRRIGTDGIITTIAGTGENERRGDGGLATRASFNEPFDIATGCAGVFVTDTQSVRRIALTAPLIAYNGVSNATGKHAIAPLQKFSVSGCKFTAGSVTINGIDAALSSVTPNLIQGVVPAGIDPGPAQVVVTVNGIASAPAIVNAAK